MEESLEKRFSVFCDLEGSVTQVLQDEERFLPSTIIGKMLFSIVVPGDLDKIINFFLEVKTKGTAIGWEINISTQTGAKTFSFFGGLFDDRIGIAAATKKNEAQLLFSELSKINNEQANIIRALSKENEKLQTLSNEPSVDYYEELSRLNNDLVNMQRELSKEKSNLQATLKELKETQQMLIHSEKMNALGQLVAGVAHEINNPISFVTNNIYELEKYSNELISSYKQLEKEVEREANSEVKNLIKQLRTTNDLDYLEEDITEIIKESKEGVERVKKIVLDLRNFSRLDESDIKHIDLIENIHSILSIINSEIQKKNISFEMIAGEKSMIYCYPGQLNQAILNVLINGIQAVDENGKLSLSLEENKTEVRIRVEDDGCGISEEDLEKIFNPFYTTKPVGTGTGLGLSITYKIIEDLHQGKIEVKSAENKGSIFTLKIPKDIRNEK